VTGAAARSLVGERRRAGIRVRAPFGTASGFIFLAGLGIGIGNSSWRFSLMAMPNVGDRAPDFTLPVDRDKTVSLKDYLGKKNVVLCFYPLDFTGG
jgi:hypothetical protein